MIRLAYKSNHQNYPVIGRLKGNVNGMEAKNTYDGRGTNRSYLEIGGTVDVQNTCSVTRAHNPIL
jgi:hypothetical protein